MCLCVTQIPVLIKILWNWWVLTLILVPLHATCQKTVCTAAVNGRYACKRGVQASMFGFFTNTSISVNLFANAQSECLSKYVPREHPMETPSLRCKTKRQYKTISLNSIYSANYMLFFPFLHCLLALLFVHVVMIFISWSIFQGEQFKYLSRDNVSKCFLQRSTHS